MRADIGTGLCRPCAAPQPVGTKQRGQGEVWQSLAHTMRGPHGSRMYGTPAACGPSENRHSGTSQPMPHTAPLFLTANSLTNHRFQKPVDAMQDHKSAIGRHQMNLQHHAKDLRGLQVTGAVEIGASKLGPAKPGSSATCFPIEIRHTPGRGRGFFATRDIAQGEVVLESAPLAWTVSSEWAKHVCLWCFRCSFRKAHAVKAAVDDCYRPGTGTGTDKSNAPPARYKGAFCSDGCKQAAVAAFGGQEKWASFVALLGNIDDEARRRSNRRPLRGTPHALPNALASDLPHDLCADSGFDPDEVSDDILEGWMDSVWSTIETYQLFQDSSLDSAQTDMVRLIASQAYLRDTVAADAASPGEIIDRQFGSVGVAPPEFLEPVKANEAETLRAWLRSVQADEHLSVEDAQPASPPATIAPIRLPWNPDPREIQQSRWGRSFEAAAAAYMLLARAWKRTFGNTGSSAPTHRLFRAVYYREKANSFGIWDCPAATADADTDTDTDTDGSSGKDIDLSESECVGFAIYPSAVYFNHSCAPNVAKSRSERTYRFTSRRDIACDEELFIAYGSVSESAAERRKRLAEHFFFECSCERCIAETTIGDAAV
ncbi:hypothetical protein GGI07_003881 [Coemansia sp. Benny D115]|nr:hypothetical protein GGI07_003881 [Coemansia sp. Benny D115]